MSLASGRSARKLPHTGAIIAAIIASSLASSGCAGDQARRTRRHAELAIGGSLLGVIAGSLGIAALPGEKRIFIPITVTFGLLAVASAVVYGVAHASIEEVEEEPWRVAPPPPPEDRPQAWALTQEAQAAARSGDCVRVHALDDEVLRLDHEFHAVVFVRDAAIARCLAEPSEP
jgi:hypothetical protein